MIIILAKCGNGYAGCDAEEAFFYEENTCEKDINADICEWARDNAESFFYFCFGWDEEYTEEDYEEYMENNVEYNWRIATREEYLDYCENWGIEPREF